MIAAALDPRITAVVSVAPALGEHNRVILGGIGVDAARYAELLAAGAVCEGTNEGKGDDE